MDKMKNIVRFSFGYFLFAIILFIIEVLIALYMHDPIVRPYVGDFLVVVLLYCMVRSFLNTAVVPTVIAVLLFAYLIEWAQYLHLVERLGWQRSRLANLVLGNLFEWIDMLAYTLGAIAIVIVERVRLKRSNKVF